MSLPANVRALPEVREAIAADRRGRLIESTAGAPEGSGTEIAAAMNALAAAGQAAGLTRLELVLVKGASSSSAFAARAEAFVRVALDPSKATRGVETTLQDWAREGSAPVPRALSVEPSAVPYTPPAVTRIPPGPRALRTTPAPSSPAPPEAARDPWASLRRALVRGRLTEAAALQSALADAGGDGARPGREPLESGELERVLRGLLEGAGSVMAGDGVGGERILRELAAASQPNLSIRWLASYWSARGALKSGSLSAARTYAKEALALGRRLDPDALAASQWTAGELLSHDRDPARSLAWLAEARGMFERLGDRWGVARSWLSEARTLASLDREEEAAEAARRASNADGAWDEPHVFLARRALLRGDVASAEETLAAVKTPQAERVRSVIEAIRARTVSGADASAYLREHDAPPSGRALQELTRIANVSPRFVPAREAAAWMLLKLGKYAEANRIFRGLLAQPLGPADRASVMLGLGCIGNAQRSASDPAALRDVVAAGDAQAPAASTRAHAPTPLPQLSGSSLLARGGQPAELDAVFSGQLSVFAFPDLLEFLRSAKRTGLLVCSSTRGAAALRLKDGWVTGAASPSTPNIGELLLRARKISALALHTVPEEPDQIIGEVLVREGLAESAAVKEALEQQIGLAIRELVGWSEGEFAFSREAEGVETRTDIAVSLDPQAVLLNVFKEMDEASRPGTAGAEL